MDQLGQLLMGKQQPPLLALLLAILLVGLGLDLELQLTIQNQKLHRLTLLDQQRNQRPAPSTELTGASLDTDGSLFRSRSEAGESITL